MPALDDLVSSMGEELGGALTSMMGALADAADNELQKKQIGVTMAGALALVATALTSGSSAQLAFFTLLLDSLKKELTFRRYLYEKAMFYLRARRSILIRYLMRGDRRNLRKIIEAERQVALALRQFRGVEKGLTPPPNGLPTLTGR
jgi:hypothetical protein